MGDACEEGPSIDFDTGPGTYPSIAGAHTGTITPNPTMVVRKLYTSPCSGTGGHTEYVKIWQGIETLVEAEWAGYGGDWRNITFGNPSSWKQTRRITTPLSRIRIRRSSTLRL